MTTDDATRSEIGWQVRHADGGVLRIRSVEDMAALIARGVVLPTSPVRAPESTRFQRAALVPALARYFNDAALAAAAAAPALSAADEVDDPADYRAAPEVLARVLNDAKRPAGATPAVHSEFTAAAADRDRHALASCGTAVIRMTWVVSVVLALVLLIAGGAALGEQPGQALLSMLGGLLWLALLASLCLGLGYGMRVYAHSRKP